MALQAHLVVFSTVENPDKTLPTEEEMREAFTEMLDIPNDFVVVDMWPVEIEAQGYKEGVCRRCGEDCPDDRLFCEECAASIAGLQTE